MTDDDVTLKYLFEEDEPYIAIESLLELLSTCEQVWPDTTKRVLRSVRGAVLESTFKAMLEDARDLRSGN